MMIGMTEGVTRDRVRDQRIERAEPLTPPGALLAELPPRKQPPPTLPPLRRIAAREAS